MPRLSFTQNLRRHVTCPEMQVAGSTVKDALEHAFADSPRLRSYILDDQGGLHTHVAIMVNGEAIVDRTTLAHPLSEQDEVYVMQALSGG
ncbi:MoaD/ThiS family protein [Pelagicoccus mobilis]|uniref:MoaD/ThiS family protein n=1 Tax=Pelagicoccus mobilis TaxID=415221 RepID=A0A934S3C7_9BACT|nr:MoaD/ThiS family protein [Pelagicoccus mobilis]MBK1878664.1 MoaD/ThiS family protein [Pelagicoccus mobilis]